MFLGNKTDSDSVTGPEYDQLIGACLKLHEEYKIANGSRGARSKIALPMEFKSEMGKSKIDQNSSHGRQLSRGSELRSEPQKVTVIKNCGSVKKCDPKRGEKSKRNHENFDLPGKGKGKGQRSSGKNTKASVNKKVKINERHEPRANKDQIPRNGGDICPERDHTSLGFLEQLGKHVRNSMIASLNEIETENESITNNDEKARSRQCKEESELQSKPVIPTLKLRLKSCNDGCHKHWVIDSENLELDSS